MEHLKINNQTEQDQKREELTLLDQEQVPKTKYERLKPLANAAYWFSRLFQANSFFLATVGVCSYLWYAMGSNGIPFIALAVGLFLLVEWSNDLGIRTYAAMKFDDKVVSKVIYVCLSFTLLLSTPSTYYYTPYAVRLLTSAPELIDTSEVRILADVNIKTDTTYWHDQKYTALANATTYWNTWKKRDCNDCPWRLSSSEHIQEPYNNLIKEVKEKQDSINSALVRGSVEKDAVLYAAVTKNQDKEQAHLDWCAQFGGLLAIISAISIILLIPCRLGYEYWKRKYKADLRNSLNLTEESDVHTAEVRKEVVKEEGKVKENVIEDQQPTPIGFAFATRKEGDIIKGEGRKVDRILVRVNGELRPMTLGELNRLEKVQTGLERIQHLRKLKNKLK